MIVEEQTKDLEASNQKMQEEVEQVFMEKQRKENQLRQLREQMDKVTFIEENLDVHLLFMSHGIRSM